MTFLGGPAPLTEHYHGSDFVHGVSGVLELEEDADADNINTTVMQGGVCRSLI